MTSPEFVIPADRLPPGFAETLDRPPTDVVEPKPAATVVMLRDSDAGMEVLLLKRHRSTGQPKAVSSRSGHYDSS